MAADKEDLTRPMVSVKVPEVRLKLEDLAYLRSVGQPKAVRCFPKHGVLDRLRFLDLIARAKVPLDKESADEIAKKVKSGRADLQRAVDKCDWNQVQSHAYSLQRLARDLEPVEADILTDRGRQLLRQGEVNVKVRKVGCVA
jgi:hypothetical protein